MKKSYSLGDALETAIGAFSAMLLFIAVRAGVSGPYFDYRAGIVISSIWGYFLYNAFVKMNNNPNYFFFIDSIIVSFVAGSLVVLFGLSTISEVMSVQYFGSPAIIAYWLGLPVALLFDKYNIKSILSRYYVNKAR